MEELANNDPVIERLKRINEDKRLFSLMLLLLAFEGFETNWLTKVIGDP